MVSVTPQFHGRIMDSPLTSTEVDGDEDLLEFLGD